MLNTGPAGTVVKRPGVREDVQVLWGENPVPRRWGASSAQALSDIDESFTGHTQLPA